MTKIHVNGVMIDHPSGGRKRYASDVTLITDHVSSVGCGQFRVANPKVDVVRLLGGVTQQAYGVRVISCSLLAGAVLYGTVADSEGIREEPMFILDETVEIRDQSATFTVRSFTTLEGV